ncbi:MAG: hypothetical protein IKL24_06380 [Clostridia bacterium]|nr:hypothetical protein [Clostridia bacterium]
MKNKALTALLFGLCCLILLSSCAKKDKGNTDTTAADTAPVQNGMVYQYSGGGNSDRVVSGINYENGIETYRQSYDYWPDGRLQGITRTVNGQETESWNYNYYPEGQLMQMVYLYTDGGVECRDDYKYTESGDIQSISSYVDGESMGSTVYTYNDDGKCTKEELLDPNGAVIKHTEYTLDEKGNKVSAHFFEFGSEFAYSLYEYNKNGSVISVKNYRKDGTFTGEESFEYNADKTMKRATKKDSVGKTVSHTEYLYDDGFCYREIYYENGKPVYRYDYSKEGTRSYYSY